MCIHGVILLFKMYSVIYQVPTIPRHPAEYHDWGLKDVHKIKLETVNSFFSFLIYNNVIKIKS